jgi:hypothetical protein
MQNGHMPLSKEALLEGLPSALSEEERSLIYRNYVSGRRDSLYVDWVEGVKVLLLGPNEDYPTTASMFDYNDPPLAGLSPEQVRADYDVEVHVYDHVADSAGGPGYYPIWMSGTNNSITRLQLMLVQKWPAEAKMIRQ